MKTVKIRCLLLLTLFILTTATTADIQNQQELVFGDAKFSNGKKFNVDHLVKVIKNPAGHYADSYPSSGYENQHYRDVFSSNEGNKYLTSMDNVSDTAMANVRELMTLVDSTGIDTYKSFDSSGIPTDQGVAELSIARQEYCPYDQPNSQPCLDEYREPSGRCNHVMRGKQTWGMARTPYDRVLPPLYEDGAQAARTTEFTSGRPLKSAREISTTVTTTAVILNPDGWNAQIMQWGQYVSHDFSQLSETKRDVRCCPDQLFRDNPANAGKTPTQFQLAQLREEIRHRHGDVCIPVEFSREQVYGDSSYVCMDQKRSRPAPTHDCALGVRQQMNSVTHIIDGSVIYGSSEKEQSMLREHRGGRMKVQVVNGETLPPQRTSQCNSTQQAANRCPFAAGDNRINMTPNLMSLHAVTVNKHNQIADQLTSINPHWTDERIFQEARRILSAIEASIHYYEYLPIIMGERMIKRYSLDRYPGYDTHTNPSILNELAHAAMRFGHSTVNGIFNVINAAGRTRPVDLRPLFFNSDFIYNGGIRQCIRGMQEEKPWIVDRNIPPQIRDFLFDMKLDLISLNINRGRDHGLQSYVTYRKKYGLSYPLSWNDLRNTHPQEVIDSLKLVYTTVGDIELYIGGVTENHVEGGLIGELFANILGDGFSKLIKGDRLWFEGPNSGLTPAQIQAIKGYKYNQLLCEGAELERISDNAFLRPASNKAREVTCSSLPPLNLHLWKEKVTPQPVCYWRVVSTSPCCLGERQTTRVCVGGDNCRGKCKGRATVTSKCRCRGFWCYYKVLKRSCKFKWRSGGRLR